MVYKKINWWQASWQFATIIFVWSADTMVLFPANQILLSLLWKGISSSYCWHVGMGKGRPNSNSSSPPLLAVPISTYFYKVSESSTETTPTHNSQNVAICLIISWWRNPSLPATSLPSGQILSSTNEPIPKISLALYLHTPGLTPLDNSCLHLNLCLLELPLSQWKETDTCRFPDRQVRQGRQSF